MRAVSVMRQSSMNYKPETSRVSSRTDRGQSQHQHRCYSTWRCSANRALSSSDLSSHPVRNVDSRTKSKPRVRGIIVRGNRTRLLERRKKRRPTDVTRGEEDTR
ncbi:hypothetical protein ElyMa_005091700 [Elysia marginata]|uniref:Uncharacterized protein n=1 Tax=Elysia marginata TaxID=1093978 RepID=A0AAV4JGF4_9GAST|nr:hypothetical protein ElyMa_005091700 [Elysia marginata]